MPLEIKSNKTTYDATRSMHNRGRAAKRVKRAFISIFIVLLLLVIVGLAYTWYMGQFKPPPAQEAPKPRQTSVIPPASVVDDKSKVGVSSQTFTSKVVIGQNASVSIKTNPLAACSILVEYNKEKSTDSGLVPKKADEYGVVSWGWTVETSRPLGKWPVTVTCANAKNSGVLILDLNVVGRE